MADFSFTNPVEQYVRSPSPNIPGFEPQYLQSELRKLETTLRSIREGMTTGVVKSGSITPAKLSTGGLYWDTNGNVGIGTTSPAAKLDVGHGSGTQVKIIGGGGADTSQGAQVLYTNSSSGATAPSKYTRITYGGAWQILNNAYSAAIVSITDAGAASQGNNSASWTTTSDARIKTNVRDIGDALGKIQSLKPCHFEFKNAVGETRTGFIAQEFEEVFPGHVSEQPTPMEFKDYTETETIKTIDPNLVPYLVKAVQELKAELDVAKARITALENP